MTLVKTAINFSLLAVTLLLSNSWYTYPKEKMEAKEINNAFEEYAFAGSAETQYGPTFEAKEVRIANGKGPAFTVFFMYYEKGAIEFYHKADNQLIGTIGQLKKQLNRDQEKLVFATNGGMYQPNRTPTGLYIEDGKVLYPLNLSKGPAYFTNFYSIIPNGVFYIRKDGMPGIVRSNLFPQIEQEVKYATQSGPMLLLDGKINGSLARRTNSKFIRSGVGIDHEQGRIIFAISKAPVSFFDFSRIFLFYGCSEALYLDGTVSEMYLDTPQLKQTVTRNQFATIIAYSEKKGK